MNYFILFISISLSISFSYIHCSTSVFLIFKAIFFLLLLLSVTITLHFVSLIFDIVISLYICFEILLSVRKGITHYTSSTINCTMYMALYSRNII